MDISVRIESINEKKLVGLHMRMSMSANRTSELWRGFMPRRKEIRGAKNRDLISLQVYDDPGYFRNFDPTRSFEKWAAIEVATDDLPAGMEPFTLPAGLYAVFLYKGAASAGAETFRYIFGTWLPASGYELDERPHFEVLGEKYKNEDPESEEEIWVPIRKKQM